MLKATHRLITLALVFLFVTSPLLAQQRRGSPAKKPATTEIPEPIPTFDTLLAADSYKIYCEVRGVGGLIRSSAVNDLLDPVMKLGGPPKEFKTMVKWLSAHADVLASSRMLVAGWASRPNIPDVVVAIEFSSPEDAKKFYPELRDFMPTLFPTPTPVPSTSPLAPGEKLPTLAPKPDAPSTIDADDVLVPATPQEIRSGPGEPATPAPPPYLMKLAGSLIFISPTEFKFRSLRPRNSKLLEEDQNFNLARNRFASESLFLYVDLKTIQKEEQEQRKKYEEEARKRSEAEAANPPKVEAPENEEPGLPVEAMEDPVNMPTPDPSDPSQPTLEATVVEPQGPSGATLSGQPRPDADVINPLMFSLYGALFGGESKWPEAVAAAVVFEGDAYVLRTLILNDAENKNSAIPFAPQFISGLALAPESPNIFPADTELFVSVSLDYPQVYEGMVKAIATAEEQFKQIRTQAVKDSPPLESPFTLFEKKLGLKIKDDLMPLLGNELALALPKRAPLAAKGVTTNAGPLTSAEEQSELKATKAAEPQPVIAIAVKDREAVGRLIPKIIEALGFKGANLFAQTEKRAGTEITSYANLFSYAFVGDFLVVSPDPLATRKVVDAYLNHDTLSSNSHFKNFTRWQPRQVLGQLYVAPGLVEQYAFGASGAPGNDKVNEYLSRVNPVIDPLTYSLTNDGQGPLHELHVPKNLLQLLIAGASSESSRPPLETNEATAQTALRSVAWSETAFKSDHEDGRYGTIEELLAGGSLSKNLLENYGYRTELIVSGNKFEATAVPIDYGKTGRLSYFIDESGVLRAGDHGGGAATVADQPVE